MMFIKNRLLSLIMAFVLFMFVPVFAYDIEVQPAINSRGNQQDRVWAGTFQIVWNDFIDKYVHNPVRFREGTPISVHELNRREFTIADLSENCYYKYSGNITKNTAKEITKAIKKKFDETSDILASLDLTPGSRNFIIYAILKKDFEFINEFDKLGKSNFGRNMAAEYFGINNNSNKVLKSGVKVLFYNSENDYAVVLSTKSNDEVYLYKNNSNKEFKTIYRDMSLKASKYQGEMYLKSEDELKVPNIKFDVSKVFEEFCGKRVMGTNFQITNALETIKFNMDNKGVQLKSEAAMTFVATALPPQERPKPRYFYFDDTFVIFLKEKNKSNPYFALRVNDITKFQ